MTKDELIAAADTWAKDFPDEDFAYLAAMALTETGRFVCFDRLDGATGSVEREDGRGVKVTLHLPVGDDSIGFEWMREGWEPLGVD